MELLEECPACGAKNISKFIDCKDFTVTKESFRIVQCNACQLKFTNPRPPEIAIGPYYQSEEYISHTATKKGIINRIYLIVRQYTLVKKVQLILRLVGKSKRVFDYGAGTGDFLKTMKNAGFTVEGMEPSAQAREYALKTHGLVIQDRLGQAGNGELFDVVTMWHVLEHVHRLDKTLGALKDKLAGGGVMLVAVPNADSYDARVYKQYWAAYDVPRHLYHFNQSSMKRLLQKHGLQVSNVLPMVFDSFYVSMLSEKYKGGSILKAFFNGLWSNIKGSGDKKYYSSLIYVVRKDGVV